MPLFTAPLTGIAAALTIAAVSPVSAPNVGISTTLPISVVSCEQTSYHIFPALEGPNSPLEYDNLRISFVNRAPMPATAVRFAVTTATGTQSIQDVGTFSNGASISHNFSPAVSGENFSDAALCAVQSVTFSDGSTWQPR